MGLNKITLMEAYLIETIRSHGVSNDYLLTQVEQEDISEWEELNTNFDFNGLITLRNQNPSAFEDIINEGYSIKFLTFNGLQNLLKLKFNKQSGKDFIIGEKGINHLVMTDQEMQILKQMLSSNWVITEKVENRIKVELR